MLRLGFLSVLLCLLTWSCSITEAPVTDVYVLVDLSGTYLSGNTNDRMRSNLERLGDAIIDLGRRADEMEVHFLVIGKGSLGQEAIDEFRYHWVMFGGKKRERDGSIVKSAQLKLRLEVIRDVILSRRPEPFTDISGALALATAKAKNQAEGSRLMIILSDFEEDLPRGHLPARYDLEGFRIAMIYRVLPKDTKEPDGLPTRIQEWKNHLCSTAFSVEEDIEPGHYSRLFDRGRCNNGQEQG